MTTIDVQDREALIDSLEQTPLTANELVANATEEDLRRAGPGGTLGAVEVLAYLHDFEELFLSRLSLIIEEDNPRLEWVEDSLWPIERDYVERDPVVTFHQFVELRSQTIRALADLPIADWDRVGQHPALGQVTIRRYVERVIDRDSGYLQQLRAALRQPANGA
jgi:hypothetical protein